ncbi:MAG TPA: substrate-binding domain-containing protein [Beijerinckiaceae bacterium]
MTWRVRGCLAALAAVLVFPAAAAEVRILTSGAYKPVVEEAVPLFEKATGHTVRVSNDTAGGVLRRVEGGESTDLVVLTPTGLDGLAKKGRVVSETAAELAKVGIGVAVKEGAPKPDIATSDALKNALLEARSVAMIDPAAGGSSGIYLSKLFERWGIADQVKAKAVLMSGGYVASKLVTGEADLALHQVSEILAVKGVTLVGTLPADVQNFTVYAGAVASGAGDAEAARAFLRFLAGPEVARVLATKGMMTP